MNIKRFLTTIVLLCFVKISLAMDILNVRKMFYEAADSRSKTEELMKMLHSAEKTTIITGYTGMCYMLMAKHSYNHITKLSSFSKGKKLLEYAISADNRNIELRFLRLSVQLNAPAFLNYSDQIEQDKKTIIEEYKTVSDIDLKTRIRDFMAGIKIILNNS